MGMGGETPMRAHRQFSVIFDKRPFGLRLVYGNSLSTATNANHHRKLRKMPSSSDVASILEEIDHADKHSHSHYSHSQSQRKKDRYDTFFFLKY